MSDKALREALAALVTMLDSRGKSSWVTDREFWAALSQARAALAAPDEGRPASGAEVLAALGELLRHHKLTPESDPHHATMRPGQTCGACGWAAPASPDPEGTRCTGLSAKWCPVHGDCKCEGEYRASYLCPLHSPTSSHGPASPPSPAPEAAWCQTCDGSGWVPYSPSGGKLIGSHMIHCPACKVTKLEAALRAPAPSPAKERP